MDKTERRWPTRCIIDADAIFSRRGRKEHQEWREILILITSGRYQKFQETEACEKCAMFSHPRLISREFVTRWIIYINVYNVKCTKMYDYKEKMQFCREKLQAEISPSFTFLICPCGFVGNGLIN